MQDILVAVDGSEGALRALDYAIGLAAHEGHRLLILNVIGGYGLPDQAMRALTHAQHGWFDEMLSQNASGILTQARDHALAKGAAPPLIEVRHGEVVPTILAAAEAHGVAAIVLGRRGTGHLAALPMGSISRAVASLSSVPVTLVP